jgi:prevent-host-death family protein
VSLVLALGTALATPAPARADDAPAILLQLPLERRAEMLAALRIELPDRPCVQSKEALLRSADRALNRAKARAATASASSRSRATSSPPARPAGELEPRPASCTLRCTMTKRRSNAPRTLSIAEARASLADVVRRAESGEEVRITRRGIPVVVVRAVRSDEDERAERFRALVAQMAATPVADDGPADPWADVRDRSPGRDVPDLGR